MNVTRLLKQATKQIHSIWNNHKIFHLIHFHWIGGGDDLYVSLFYITLSRIHLTVLSARFSFNLHLSFFPNPFNEWMVFWFLASWTSSNTFEGYNQPETSSIKGEKHTLFDHWNYPSKTLAAVFSIGTTNESIILHPFSFFSFHFILASSKTRVIRLQYNIFVRNTK